MVAGTVAAVAIVSTGGAAAAVGAGFGMAAGTGGATAGTSAAIGTAIGVGTSSGAIAGAGAVAAGGATAAASATGAAVGAAAGGTAAAGVGGAGAALGAIASGPVGWICLGADEKGITFDCWKPVIHDTSVEPSSGMLIKDIVCHPNIANVTIESGDDCSLPHIVLENVWNENFELEFYMIRDSGRLVAHAKQIMV